MYYGGIIYVNYWCYRIFIFLEYLVKKLEFLDYFLWFIRYDNCYLLYYILKCGIYKKGILVYGVKLLY